MSYKENAPEAEAANKGNILGIEQPEDTKISRKGKGNLKKPHRNTRHSPTKSESYLELLLRDTNSTQEAVTYRAILSCPEPVNSRQLVNLTSYERSDLTRVLYNLKEAEVIDFIVKPCKITKRRVEHYFVVNSLQQIKSDKISQSEANTIIITETTQGELFNNYGRTNTVKP